MTRLGFSVSAGDTAIVAGSPYDDIGGEDSGVAWVHESLSGALLYRLDNPNPSRTSHFGWSVATSGSRVVVGAPMDNTGASDAGIAYVYDLNSGTPTVPVVVLTNPDPGNDDVFGWSVAISGDHVIVGAPKGNYGTPDAGCAYVFNVASGTPAVPVLQIANPDVAGMNFGHSVAVDGTAIVVGSIQSGGVGDSNRAYVFDLLSGAPALPVHTLADPSPGSDDQFGSSVAISGDRVVVSAPKDDSGALNAGAAYAFDLESATPTVPLFTFLNPNPADEDSFGTSVSISGDRLVVGAGFDDQTANDSGRSYLYHLDAPIPDLPALIVENPSPQSGDKFGCSVSLSGTRMVIGASDDRTGARDVGSAYVFDIASGSPGQVIHTINNPSPSSFEEFGRSVAISGNRIVIGSPDDNKVTSNSGSVSLYDLSSPNPHQPSVLIDNPSPAENDYFGTAVAVSGNLVAVGADHDDTGFSNAGIVYIYDASSGTPAVPLWTLPNPSPQSQEIFGNSVAIEGHLVVVGCSQDKQAGFEAGSVYVFDLASGTPAVPVATIHNPSPVVDDQFGHAVAISGSLVVVGCPGKDQEAPDAGRAYVYDVSTPSLPLFVLENPTPVADDQFGYSVAVSGPFVVVGSPGDDAVAMDAGSACVFDLAGDFPTVPEILHHPQANADSYFGSAVALAGTRLVVGAPDDDIEVANGGACYVYELTSATFPTPADRLKTEFQATDDRFGAELAIDNANILVGVPGFDSDTEDRGIACFFDPDPPSPELQVEQPPGIGLVGSGASIPFGNVAVGSASAAQPVIVRNIGTADLEIGGISVLGGNQIDFSVSFPGLPAVLSVDQTMVIQVSFVPGTKGPRASSLRIASNAGSGDPFDIVLTGQALSPEDDTDGDGVNDVAELEMEPMGFDWQVNDEELLQVMKAGANVLGLYSGPQLQSTDPAAPLLPINPGTGLFKLTISVSMSENLVDFSPFPIESTGASVNGEGAFEFRFSPIGQKGFFRLEPR